jgi:hypothetical protein
MTKDDRNILEVFKAELEFIEKGGYGRSVKTPSKPTSVFVDSLSCLNYADPSRPQPCSDCLLIDFVPPAERSESVPCHHIPLNAAKETVDSIEQRGDQEKLEDAVKNWLRKRIYELEQERAGAPA